MSKIAVMDEILANKIAAGEVVEKTMNVVKELVENSIDAKSSEIRVDLIDSGVKEIRVIDDGIGMDRNDAILAFSRHATSKLKTLDDLFNINSLGFRGEALPSIASVSLVTLKTSNGKEGTLLHIDGGHILDINGCDIRQGTTITINNLFYNTPVRLKYLKNLYIELANITDYINKIALSYPNIKFTLTNNDKILLKTDGSGQLLKVIHFIYGVEVAKKMIEVNAVNDDYKVTGYISYPEITKANRNSITVMINNRVIRNNEINRLIIDCYHTYVPLDKYPIIVLNIEVDPILIDVNVHPTKMDIKFSKMESLKQLLVQSIKEKLESLLLIPNIKTRTIEEEEKSPVSITEVAIEEVSDTNDIDMYQQKEEIRFDFQVNDSVGEVPFLLQEKSEDSENNSRIKPMHPVGLVHGTYIIAENEDGMYIIDQHAANERINYEKYKKSMGEGATETIEPLFPISIELPNNEYIILKEHFDLLTSYHFDIEEFGGNTIVIRRHPIWIPKGHEVEAIRKMIDIIVSKEEFTREKFIEKAAITLACKMSIKANDHISLEEMEHLLTRLSTCFNPFTCPHGRPTIIAYSKYELEKLFKRAMN